MDKANQNAVSAMSANLARMGGSVEAARAGAAAGPVIRDPVTGALRHATHDESSSLAGLAAAAHHDAAFAVPGAAGPMAAQHAGMMARLAQYRDQSAAAAAASMTAAPVAAPGLALSADAMAREFSALAVSAPSAVALQQQQQQQQQQQHVARMGVPMQGGHPNAMARQHESMLLMQQQQHQHQHMAQMQQQMQMQSAMIQQQQQQQQMHMQQQQQQAIMLAQAQAQAQQLQALQLQQQQQQAGGADKASSRLFSQLRAQRDAGVVSDSGLSQSAAAATATPEEALVAGGGAAQAMGPGLNGAMLGELMEKSEKWRNSEFVKFLNGINSNELELRGDGVYAVDPAAKQEEMEMYNRLYGDEGDDDVDYDQQEEEEEEARLAKEEADFIQRIQNGETYAISLYFVFIHLRTDSRVY